MLDFNSRPPLLARIGDAIDAALLAEHIAQPKRNYLGASRLGHACERALQFEFTHTPTDPDRGFSAQLLRIFEVGHALEDRAIRWLRLAGFDLHPRMSNGEPYGFAAADGRIAGHVDGIVASGPVALGLRYPMLWECKSACDRTFNELVKHGVSVAKPIYAGQMSLYQAYLAERIPGIADHPALFTVVNKDTQALHIELVPFDSALAQRLSDRGVRILQATDAGELLPRIATTPTHFNCKACAWQDRCWRLPS